MGGGLGLAILASLAASRTDSLLASGDDRLAALTGGYHVSFLVGAVFAIAAAGAGAFLRETARPHRPTPSPRPPQRPHRRGPSAATEKCYAAKR